MTNFEMVHLFPTPLFVSDVPELKEEHRQFIMNCDYESDPKYSLTSDKHILDRPELKIIKDSILDKVNLYNKNGYNIQTKNDMDDFEFYIKTSWAIKITRGYPYAEHLHSRSVFSGVLYINVDDNSGNINFSREHLNSTFSPFGFSVTEWNQFNCDTWYIKPTVGKLVLFPSSLKHFMTDSESDITRYSVAFDVFIKGYMGKGMTGETYY